MRQGPVSKGCRHLASCFFCGCCGTCLGFAVVLVVVEVLVACTRALGLGVVTACVSCARQIRRIAACHIIRNWVICLILNVIADNCALLTANNKDLKSDRVRRLNELQAIVWRMYSKLLKTGFFLIIHLIDTIKKPHLFLLYYILIC